MCVNPRTLDNGLLVSCRECWQCRETYISDWVGRCIAEAEDAAATHLVTLTYGGGDHIDARVLNYDHVRAYLKKIRSAGYPVRYFCVGEYGSTKGRAHWHMLLFWQGEMPKLTEQFMDPTEAGSDHSIRMNWSYNQYFWPHGHSKYEVAEVSGARYVMKYMQKDFRDPENDAEYGMSSHPLLGWRYYKRLAKQYVDQQLAPQDKLYRFRDVRTKQDRPVEFYMSRNVWLFFCQQYLLEWRSQYGDAHRPTSPMLDDYEDLIAKRVRDAVEPALEMAPHMREPLKPWVCPRTGRRYHDGDTQAPVGWSTTLQAWYYPAEPEVGVPVLFWSFNDSGEPAWQSVIRTAAWAERRRAELELRKASGKTYETESRGR